MTAIAASGDLQMLEQDAVGTAGDVVNAIYLVTSNEAGVNYGANPDNKRMQIVLERPFKALLAQPGLPAGLQVLKAFDPANPGFHKSGRALRISHLALAADQLGVLAYRHSGRALVCEEYA